MLIDKNKYMSKNAAIGVLSLVTSLSLSTIGPVVAQTQPELFIAYPPPEHKTTAAQIFLIGTAGAEGEVFINDQPIPRSPKGHFAPSFPLNIGENTFNIRYKNQKIKITVNRINNQPVSPTGLAFAENSLFPDQNIAVLPGELICFRAVAATDAQVTVKIGNRTIPLFLETDSNTLPPNSAILTANNQPKTSAAKHQGCMQADKPGNLGKPTYKLSLQGKIRQQAARGNINILNPTNLEVVEIIAQSGVTRTGASTNYSRLTPLPQGVRAAITAQEGEWIRLDYGAWIKEAETRLIARNIPPKSLIRSITSRSTRDSTEIIFPLQIPVPVKVKQADSTFSLILYSTTAQTDTIRLDPNPYIRRLDWQQTAPDQIEYTFNLKTQQQWGYDLHYEGTSLILTLRHPPKIQADKSLQGRKILIDAGHGGQELGARGPNGYPEKDVNLIVAQLLKQELQRRGAKVIMTRETDIDVSLQARVATIDKVKPDLALSIHYNALPDDGDAMNTQGIGMFWYHPQANDLAIFLHDFLVKKLNRPSYGVFWNNLALTRPHTAPSVLLELGFMINPTEFEWITDSQAQKKLAKTLAEGIELWVTSTSSKSKIIP